MNRGYTLGFSLCFFKSGATLEIGLLDLAASSDSPIRKIESQEILENTITTFLANADKACRQ